MTYEKQKALQRFMAMYINYMLSPVEDRMDDTLASLERIEQDNPDIDFCEFESRVDKFIKLGETDGLFHSVVTGKFFDGLEK